MKNLIGLFILSILLSGCMVTASSGTRTEYENKIKVIEQKYKEKKITEAEYIQLKDQAGKPGNVGQRSESVNSDQSNPMSYDQSKP